MSHNYHMWFVSPNYHTTLYQIEKLLSIKFNKKKEERKKKKRFWKYSNFNNDTIGIIEKISIKLIQQH